jgi:predicted nucleic acid-binding protein
MTVVDTSVWIDYFNGRRTPETDRLEILSLTDTLVMGDIILAEVLQGFRADDDFENARSVLGALDQVSMLGPVLAVRSAENYRALRRSGVTVRKTIDMMIATWCISAGEALLYADRDFDPCVEHLGLIDAMDD